MRCAQALGGSSPSASAEQVVLIWKVYGVTCSEDLSRFWRRASHPQRVGSLLLA